MRMRQAVGEDPLSPLCPDKNARYAVSQEKYVGKFPVRTELSVLEADGPTESKVGWTVRGYLGSEVYRHDLSVYSGGFVDVSKLSPITEESGLSDGDELMVRGIAGFHLMRFTRESEGRGRAESGELSGLLEFGSDDRRAWVCTGLFNLRALKKLSLSSE